MKQKFTNRELFWLWIAKNRMQPSQYDSIKGWKRFNEKDHGEHQRIFVKRVVAVIALLIGFGGLLVWYSSKQSVVIPDTSEIVRAVGGPVLTLANGKTVSLVDSIAHHIRESDADVVINDSLSLKYIVDKNQKTTEEEVYNTLYIPKGGKYSLVLADGTRIWLNSETTLRYPVNFIGRERVVQLEGEAYFEVAKNSKQPFVAVADGVKIKVLGTCFNVSTYSRQVVTTLVEGQVSLNKDNNNIVLKPNQQGVWKDNKFQVKQVDAADYILWRDDIFYFDDMNLETILEAIARSYNMNIVYQSSSLKSKRFSIKIKRYENVVDILRRIEQTKQIKFLIDEDCINVYAGID